MSTESSDSHLELPARIADQFDATEAILRANLTKIQKLLAGLAEDSSIR